MASYVRTWLGGSSAPAETDPISDFRSKIQAGFKETEKALSEGIDNTVIAKFAKAQADRFELDSKSEDPFASIGHVPQPIPGSLIRASQHYDGVSDFFNAKINADDVTKAQARTMRRMLAEESQFLATAVSENKSEGDTGVYGIESGPTMENGWLWGKRVKRGTGTVPPSNLFTMYPTNNQLYQPIPKPSDDVTPPPFNDFTSAPRQQSVPSMTVKDLAALIHQAASYYTDDNIASAIASAVYQASQETNAVHRPETAPSRASFADRSQSAPPFSHMWGHGGSQPPPAQVFVTNNYYDSRNVGPNQGSSFNPYAHWTPQSQASHFRQQSQTSRFVHVR